MPGLGSVHQFPQSNGRLTGYGALRDRNLANSADPLQQSLNQSGQPPHITDVVSFSTVSALGHIDVYGGARMLLTAIPLMIWCMVWRECIKKSQSWDTLGVCFWTGWSSLSIGSLNGERPPRIRQKIDTSNQELDQVKCNTNTQATFVRSHQTRIAALHAGRLTLCYHGLLLRMNGS